MSDGSFRFIAEQHLPRWLDQLATVYQVYVPACISDHYSWSWWAPGCAASVALRGYRTVEPLKAFLFRAREVIARGFRIEFEASAPRPLCVVGARACDLEALAILDSVFLDDEPVDPFYQRWRQTTRIIAADCGEPGPYCFCTALGGKPFPETGYDLNVSGVNGGFLVGEGSRAGRELIAGCANLFVPAVDALLDEVGRTRRQVTERVQQSVEQWNVPGESELAGVVARRYDSPVWEEEARECVECGACNTICPTCHCFLLYDQPSQAGVDGFVRLRTWDACLLRDFARVAGGGNPRPRLWMRLRNRFVKKFDFFPQVLNKNACTGCGRCVEACPAGIDIRRILRRLTAADGTQRESISTH